MRNFSNKKKLTNLFSLIFLNLFLILLLTNCASSQKAYHQYIMRGTILEVDGEDVFLCIGSKDGAQVNQELDTYDLQNVVRPKGSKWKKEKTGKIKITEIVDEHFAKGKVIFCNVKVNDIAEIEMKR